MLLGSFSQVKNTNTKQKNEPNKKIKQLKPIAREARILIITQKTPLTLFALNLLLIRILRLHFHARWIP